MYHLNKFKCIASPTVVSTVTTDYWFDQIKNSSYVPLINIARQYKCLMINSQDEELRIKYKIKYDQLKGEFPTVAYNVLFNDHRLTADIIRPTGLLYIDIDNPAFDIEILNKNMIYSYYKSVGGLGWGILVKIEGLTPENYSSTFDTTVDLLGISEYIDEKAKGIVQQSVLSFDPEIFINEKSKVFNSVNTIQFCTPPPIKNQFREEHIRVSGYNFENSVRYNNIYDFEFDGDYIYNWESGFAFVRCYLPTTPLIDKRKRTLMSYLNNLLWLNPNIQYSHALNILDSVNKKICKTALPLNRLEDMLQTIIRQKNEGKLKPHITVRRILFAPHSCLEGQDKLHICGRLIKEKWLLDGCRRLEKIVRAWDFEAYGKITVSNIAKYSNMNRKTVAKYYAYYKDTIILKMNKDYIKAIKENKSISVERMLNRLVAA